MNRLLVYGVLTCCTFYSVNAQSVRNILPIAELPKEPRFTINIHGGYSFALGSTFKFYPDDIRSVRVTKTGNAPANSTTEYETVKKGLGEGVRVGAGFSYTINDFINVGIDFDYFKSTIRKHRDSSYYEINGNVNPMANERMYDERITTSYQTQLLTFVPNITFKAISRPKFFIYNKIGAVLSFRPNSLQREDRSGTQRLGWQGFYQDSSFSTSMRYDWGIRNPSFGFMGAIGTQIRMTTRTRAFAELQFSHIVFRTASRSLTSKVVNGEEQVQTLSTREREIIFTRDYTQSGTNSDPNEPVRAVTQRFPISYVGLQVGIAYRF